MASSAAAHVAPLSYSPLQASPATKDSARSTGRTESPRTGSVKSARQVKIHNLLDVHESAHDALLLTLSNTALVDAIQRITRVLRAVNAVRRLDFHFLRAPTDWVADISALLTPLYGSLEEFKLTVSAISTEQAGAIAAVLAHPGARLHRLEVRTTLPLEAPAVAAIAGALRSNLALSELLLTHVAAEDEEVVLGVIGEAYLANSARADAAAAAGGAAAAHSDVLHHDAPFIPSRELRVVVGGRHKLFTLPAWGARAV